MKLLLFSDIHCSVRHAEKIADLSKQADIVVGAGDFGSLRRGLNKTIDILKKIEKPTVLVPGNAESDEELREACAGWKNSYPLHGDSANVSGVVFFGLGGGIPVTPFGDWSYDFTEDEAREMLKNCPKDAVLVSHSPPKDILDRSSSGQHFGSVAVKEFIQKNNPRLVVCGHIHESGGKQERFNGALVVNAGPGGLIVEMP